MATSKRKVILVTGSSSGIGAELARLAARNLRLALRSDAALDAIPGATLIRKRR